MKTLLVLLLLIPSLSWGSTILECNYTGGDSYAKITIIIDSHYEARESIGHNNYIYYEVNTTDSSYFLYNRSGWDGRTWTIDRYTGDATLKDTGLAPYQCLKASKKF